MLCYVERLKHLLPIFMRWDGETRSEWVESCCQSSAVTRISASQTLMDVGLLTSILPYRKHYKIQCDCNSMAFTFMVCCSERTLFLFSLKGQKNELDTEATPKINVFALDYKISNKLYLF